MCIIKESSLFGTTSRHSSFNNNIEDDVWHYQETKSISDLFVNYVNNSRLSSSNNLYRGDCNYPSKIKKGNVLRFYNSVASFTFNLDVARKFINPKCAPDWYYDDYEWISEDPFPFEDCVTDKETLVPVIYIISENDSLKIPALDMSRFDSRFKEHEVVLSTDNLNFIIEKVDDIYIYLELLDN